MIRGSPWSLPPVMNFPGLGGGGMNPTMVNGPMGGFGAGSMHGTMRGRTLFGAGFPGFPGSSASMNQPSPLGAMPFPGLSDGGMDPMMGNGRMDPNATSDLMGYGGLPGSGPSRRRGREW